MKTAKFLATLLAAFVLSLTLASCGDDDSEPTPAPSPTPNTPAMQITPNVFKLDGKTFSMTYGWAERQRIREDGYRKYMITVQSLPQDYYLHMEPSAESPLHTFTVTFYAPPAEELPLGKFRIWQAYGELNITTRSGSGLNYYHYMDTDGCGLLEIKKDGSNYTFSLNPLVVQYSRYDEFVLSNLLEYGKIARTSFAFSGELPFTIRPE